MTKKQWLTTRAALSNTAATSHMWLFKFLFPYHIFHTFYYRNVQASIKWTEWIQDAHMAPHQLQRLSTHGFVTHLYPHRFPSVPTLFFVVVVWVFCCFIKAYFTSHKIYQFQLYNSVISSNFTKRWNHHHKSVLEHFITSVRSLRSFYR